jgi:hypothetical protein
MLDKDFGALDRGAFSNSQDRRKSIDLSVSFDLQGEGLLHRTTRTAKIDVQDIPSFWIVFCRPRVSRSPAKDPDGMVEHRIAVQALEFQTIKKTIELLDHIDVSVLLRRRDVPGLRGEAIPA